MTDKQIIIDGVQFNKWGDFLIDYELNGIYKTISSSDKCYKILKSLIEQLLRKEQECEELKNKLTKSIFEDGKKQIALDIAIYERDKLKQTLTEIKSILELYANSKVGEEQPDGTYKLSGGIWDSFGFCTTTYDPRPARQALQKISECEGNDE